MFTFANFKEKVTEIYGAGSAESRYVKAMEYNVTIEASCVKNLEEIAKSEYNYLLDLYPEVPTGNIFIDRVLREIRPQKNIEGSTK